MQNSPNEQAQTRDSQQESKPKSSSLIILEELTNTIEETKEWLVLVRDEVAENTDAYRKLVSQIGVTEQLQEELYRQNELNAEWHKELIEGLSNINDSFSKENDLRKDFLNSLPKEVKANLSRDNLEIIEKINKKAYFLKFFFYFGVGFFIFGFANFFYINNVAAKWYAESIKSHQEMLNDYQQRGNTVVSIRMVDSLKQNSEMIKQFVNKNPKDAKNFINFAKGYHSKK